MTNKQIADELRSFASGRPHLLSVQTIQKAVNYSDWPRKGLHENGDDAYRVFLLLVAEAIE